MVELGELDVHPMFIPCHPRKHGFKDACQTFRYWSTALVIPLRGFCLNIWKPQIWWLINMLPLKVAILGGYTSLPNTEKSYCLHILYPMIRTWYPHYITFSSCTRFVTALADERPAAHAKAAPLCSTFRARFCNVRKRSSRISRVNCCCSPLWRNEKYVMKCESKKNVSFFYRHWLDGKVRKWSCWLPSGKLT